MGTGAQLGKRASGFWFGFSVVIGLLASIGTVGLYFIALLRGGGLAVVRDGVPGIGRFVPLIAVAGIVAAIVIAHRVPPRTDRDSELPAPGLTAGVAAAGAATLLGTLAHDGTDLGEIGRMQIAVAGCAFLVIVGSPLIGRAIARHRLIEKFAWLTLDEEWGAASKEQTTTGLRSWELAAALAGLVVLAAGLAYVLSSGPLGHDESVYALKARSWYAGTPSTGFGIYRPPGLPAIGWLVLHFSDSEVALRGAAITLALGAVAVMWVAGRTMLSPAAAWIGAAVFVTSASYLRRATEFLNDLTAAALLLSTMLIIWYHFERRPGGWWIVAAAPLGAAAYYFRYGSAPGLAIIAVVAGAVWFKELGKSWKQIVATAAAMIALLIPHFLYSVEQTGSLLGVFGRARTSVGGGGGGLGDYLRWFPQRLAGPIGAVLMTAALIFTVVLAVRSVRDRQWPQIARSAIFLTCTTIPFTVFLGAFTHGEPRFVFMPIMALLLLGGQALVASILCLRQAARRVITVALGVVILGSFGAGVILMNNVADGITGQFDVVVGAADAVRGDVGSGDCSIRSSYVPQLTWYSECATFTFTNSFPTGQDPAYMVLFEHGKRQPEGAALDAELVQTPGTPFAVVVDPRDRVGDAFIYEYRRDHS